MIGSSPFTSDELADALGCCRGNTSRKVQVIEERLLSLLDEPQRWAGTGHPYRVASALTAFLGSMGAIVRADPVRARLWIEQLIEGRARAS